MKMTNNNWAEIPDDVWDALARAFLAEIQEISASEEGQREFEEWKKHNVHKTDT